jgi:hypothetical protein
LRDPTVALSTGHWSIEINNFKDSTYNAQFNLCFVSVDRFSFASKGPLPSLGFPAVGMNPSAVSPGRLGLTQKNQTVNELRFSRQPRSAPGDAVAEAGLAALAEPLACVRVRRNQREGQSNRPAFTVNSLFGFSRTSVFDFAAVSDLPRAGFSTGFLAGAERYRVAILRQ